MIKSTSQGAFLFGGVLTFTGMIGMLRIFTAGLPPNPTLRIVSLFVPQGWVVDGLITSMNGGSAYSVTWVLGVMLLWSLVFFTLGVWRFQKRYA